MIFLLTHPLILPKGYLGDSVEEQEEWNLYDACAIVSAALPGRFDDILIDCGTADTFLKAGQLLPEVQQTPDLA